MNVSVVATDARVQLHVSHSVNYFLLFLFIFIFDRRVNATFKCFPVSDIYEVTVIGRRMSDRDLKTIWSLDRVSFI